MINRDRLETLTKDELINLVLEIRISVATQENVWYKLAVSEENPTLADKHHARGTVLRHALENMDSLTADALGVDTPFGMKVE